MATEGAFVYDESYKAGADLSAKQFFIVKSSGTADAVALAAATTDKPLGILQNKPTSGHAASVRKLGISKVSVAAGTIAVDDYLGPDTNGQAAKVTYTAGSVGSPIIGRAMDAYTGAAGAIIRVDLLGLGSRITTA